MIDVIAFLDQYSFVFDLCFTAIGAAGGFSTKLLHERRKKRKIRKFLSLQKKDCKIILPNYMKKVHSNVIPVAPVEDIKAASNIIDLIHATGLYSHQQSIIYESNYYDSFENHNVFCIGGSLANQYSYELFKQFFPKFKIYATEEKIRTNPNNVSADHFIMSDSKKGFCWGDSSDEEFLINSSERYAIMVKVSNEDFKLKNYGTVHILFGNGTEGTLAISRYLLNDYKDLYKRVKKKKHYFVAFKINRATGIIKANSFIDLTDKMFPPPNKVKI